MAPLPTPDDSLLAQVRRGDRAALATVYDMYAPAIYRYLVRRTGNQRVAEDLTGVVFLKVLDAIHKQQAWTATFVGWLYRIAHNAVVDHFRSTGRRNEDELDETVESFLEAPDWAADRATRLARIHQALNSLTADQAQVILLRFGEELSHQEVADIMGKSEGAIKLLQHRAIHALRKLLVPEEL
jgi:RNA polymerase sigma-70 factor (ECF subfamily)